MSESTQTVRTYPAGVPSWIDVSPPDLDAAQEFYGRLFGWTFDVATPPGVPRYVIARLDGEDAAGLADGSGDDAAGGVSPGWATYVAVEDIHVAIATVEERGGTVLRAPEAAGEGGWSAAFADPAGVELRLWQAKRRPGVQALNRPGAWNFSDLHTDDPDGVDFAAELFGWVVERSDYATMLRVPGYGDHLEATVDPDIRARQVGAPPGFADAVGWVAPADAAQGLPPHWHVSFTVADRDETASLAEREGAEVLAVVDDDWTRRALIRDPRAPCSRPASSRPRTPPDRDAGRGCVARSALPRGAGAGLR